MLFIRVDDYPGTKPEEFGEHNLSNFKRFDHYMQKHGCSYVLGVIPRHTKYDDLKWLANQSDRVEIALHGISHYEDKLDEFLGRSYREVENAIMLTKNSLEGALGYHVTSYIPPHNVLNPDTVLALSRLGFRAVFGGPGTSEDMKVLVEKLGMEYIHSEPPLEYGRSDELMERGAVEYLHEESYVQRKRVWLTLHWPWEWNIGLSNLDRFLSQIGYMTT